MLGNVSVVVSSFSIRNCRNIGRHSEEVLRNFDRKHYNIVALRIFLVLAITVVTSFAQTTSLKSDAWNFATEGKFDRAAQIL